MQDYHNDVVADTDDEQDHDKDPHSRSISRATEQLEKYVHKIKAAQMFAAVEHFAWPKSGAAHTHTNTCKCTGRGRGGGGCHQYLAFVFNFRFAFELFALAKPLGKHGTAKALGRIKARSNRMCECWSVGVATWAWHNCCHVTVDVS